MSYHLFNVAPSATADSPAPTHAIWLKEGASEGLEVIVAVILMGLVNCSPFFYILT